MNIKSLPLEGYERYQLEWMIEHGYSLEDLMNKIAEIINEKLTVSGNAYNFVNEAFEILSNEDSFNSEIWVSESEWTTTEKLRSDLVCCISEHEGLN